MPQAGVDSLLMYGFTAMIAHFLMSLGQTLFHRHLGHSRLGGRFLRIIFSFIMSIMPMITLFLLIISTMGTIIRYFL